MSKRPTSGISRRDFLNGTLLAAGGAWVGNSSPMRALAQSLPDVDHDARALRGGNLPSVFSVGHWMRDRRLTFTADSVSVSPSRSDSQQGTFPILSDNGKYDVIIVGSGISGLAGAFFLMSWRPLLRVLLLDANPGFGGNAARDDAPPIPVPAASGASYGVLPQNDFVKDIYRKTGVDWHAHEIPGPMYSYFFDDRTPFVRPGARGWSLNVYGSGLKEMPYARQIVQHLEQARKDFVDWYHRSGSPTDPADRSDPKYDYLASITFDEYITRKKGWHAAVSDFYTRYSIDALAGTTKQVSAHTAISFLGSEYHPTFAFPGGNSGVARHILRRLIPEAIGGSTTAEIIAGAVREERLDDPNNAVRLRQRAVVVRADDGPRSTRVVYYQGGRFYAASARAVILAGGSHTAQHMVEHLLDAERREAWKQVTSVPVVCASVTVRRAAPLVDLGLGYNQYWWGSKYWADFVIADWVTPRRADRERATALSFYGGNWEPPENMPAERFKLLSTPFASYEESLREDLNRVLAPGDFDFDRDVSAVYIYRWGHGMVYPKPGFAFGEPKVVDKRVFRTPSARHAARKQIGRISFAGQDTEGSPSMESAIGSGYRAAEEVVRVL